MTGTRLLVVSPAFHGYWRAIEQAFTTMGYAVVTHCYDEHLTLGSKLRVKQRELATRLGRDDRLIPGTTERACAALTQADPDVVLLVKGDTLGPAFWELLEQRRQRRALWLYDELRRTAHTPQTLAAAGPIASYSPLDVETLRSTGHEAHHVPVAFDTSVRFGPQPAREVVFVGARYPARESLLDTLSASDVPVRAYGRDWSRHPVDRIRTWRVGAPGVPSGRDLPRPRAYGVMAGAAAALNVHGDQDGFTMRTFEACGVGGVQLVDRADVSRHYDPDTEVGVFSSPDEAVELARRALQDHAWAAGLRRQGQARTLAEHTFMHRAVQLESLWA